MAKKTKKTNNTSHRAMFRTQGDALTLSNDLLAEGAVASVTVVKWDERAKKASLFEVEAYCPLNMFAKIINSRPRPSLVTDCWKNL